MKRKNWKKVFKIKSQNKKKENKLKGKKGEIIVGGILIDRYLMPCWFLYLTKSKRKGYVVRKGDGKKEERRKEKRGAWRFIFFYSIINQHFFLFIQLYINHFIY